MTNFVYILISIIAINIIPFIIGQNFSIGEQKWYRNASNNIPNIPPGYVFGIVWTILYSLMGISLYLILNSPPSQLRNLTIIFFIFQYVLNLSFTPLFVNGYLFLSTYTILLTIMFTMLVILSSLNFNPYIGLLLVPYLTWLFQALYFNNRLNELIKI